MTDTNSNDKQKRDLEDVLEDEPQSKHGKQGQARHDHERAGPNSQDYGKTVAPQMGDHHGTDREVGAHGKK